MEHKVCNHSEAWKQAAMDWLAGHKSSGARSLYVPAGQTAVPLYAEHNHPASPFAEFELLQIDEVITGAKQNLFHDFFKEHLSRLPKGVRPMGDAATQADLAWLGLGLNGHVGFHEPGIDPRMFSGCVRLSAKSTETLQLEPDTWGLTYGVGAFMACKAILILVRGESKREVLTRLLRADPALPASHLLGHGNLTILSDFSF